MKNNPLKGALNCVGDFETTVFEGQENTEVWASAIVPLYTEDVSIFTSIDDTFYHLISLQQNLIIYYHNLKFDGTFWISFLLRSNYKEAYMNTTKTFYETEDMPLRTFKYLISDRGMWYTITIRTSFGYYIEIRDSLKLLPFSVKKLGEDFKTKHRKSEIEYTGFRKAGGKLTKEEQDYISNDVLVVKEALEIMFNQKHNRLTIGSCCMAEFKKTIDYYDFQFMFPNLYEHPLKGEYGEQTVGSYIHKSYKGGWCYLVEGKENKVFKNGLTADVNSLYPSVMSSESGSVYPVGTPTFWKGDIPNFVKRAKKNSVYYFVRLRTRFVLKEGYLPFIQVKSNPLYKATECLKTSDIRDKNGEYHSTYIDIYGNEQDAKVELTLTCVDYILFCEHYFLYDTEYLDGCFFSVRTPEEIFDSYIDKWKEIKMHSEGALRTLAKLFLNNLYGKMATWINNSYKHAYIKEDGSLGFEIIPSYEGRPGYIPIGSAITSYARNFTIRAAQKNYHGVDKPGFIYADTDSIHCDLKPEELIDIPIHKTDFCHWKLEAFWDEAIFVRQKTYIEHVTHEDEKPVKKPYYNLKCAGMNDKCKYQFIKSLSQEPINQYDLDHFDDEQIEFMKQKRELTDFKVGLKIQGKLRPKQIEGGTLLVETSYIMR